MEGMGLLVKARDELILEKGDHDFLPEGEEDGDFDGEELEECGVWGEWTTQGMIKEDEVV